MEDGKEKVFEEIQECIPDASREVLVFSDGCVSRAHHPNPHPHPLYLSMVAAALYKNSAVDVIYYLFRQNSSFLNHAFNRNVDSDTHAADVDAPDE